MRIIPSRETKTVTQINRGNILGDIWSSFNLDLQENPGAIRVSPRLKLVTKTGDTNATNLGIPVGFKFFDGRSWTIAGNRVFKNTGQNMNSAWEEDSSSGAVTTYDSDYSDLENFNDTLVTTSASNFYSKAPNDSGTGAWTDRTSTLNLSSGAAHIVRSFKKLDRAYITDSRSIKSVATDWSVATSGDYYISLGTFSTPIFTIVSMEMNSTDVWIAIVRDLSPDGTAQNRSSTTQAAVLQWDGISSTITKEYPIEGATGILSLKIKNDAPIIMDSNGILREFNGYGFPVEKTTPRLPISTRGYLGFPTDTGNTKRFIHPNGMAVSPNGTVILNICNRNSYLIGTTESVQENLPSGIWEYTPENGLVHKQSFSYMPVGSTSVTDHGQNRILKAGGIGIQKLYTTTGIINTLFAGCEYYTNATATTKGIFTDASYPSDNATYPEGQKFGYFVTTWTPAEAIKDMWKKVWLKYRKFLDSSDKVWVKYRLTEAAPLEISITWVDTTSFTTTTNVSSYVGYEVEIIQGTGSGKCAHISTVSGSGPYTVTVDETFTGVTTGSAKARLQAWVKASSVSDQVSESTPFSIGKASERVQIKCCMQFTGDDEVHELILLNEPNQLLA